MRAAAALLALTACHAHQHEGYGELNPVLGTHGFPDCVPGPKGVSADIEANQHNMICKQKVGAPTAKKIACVGDRCVLNCWAGFNVERPRTAAHPPPSPAATTARCQTPASQRGRAAPGATTPTPSSCS